MAESTRSPLRNHPLRLPGQSLDQDIREVQGRILESVTFLAFILVLTILEWYRWAFETPYSPWIYSVLLVLCSAWSIPRVLRRLRHLRHLRLGRDGERAVGQTLERLRENGYHVFHDLVASDCNIDHVVIGPGGVFTVETKTWSKPTRGEALIVHDDGGLRCNKIDLSNCLVQAKAQASFVRRLLAEELGKVLPVQPTVLFPGWYVECKLEKRDVWVLEAKAFLKWVKKQPRILSEEQVRIARRIVSAQIRQSYAA
jgi:hypothetical protein